METKELLQGDKWLGHPVHPAFVSGPIGMWTLSFIMDTIAIFSKNECVQDAADYAMTAGLVSAGLAASTGLAEYSRVPNNEAAQKDALKHGALNVSATALYGVNAAIRGKRRSDGRSVGFLPKFLSLVGIGLISYTGWLGGRLAYGHGTGVKLEGIIDERSELNEESKEKLKASI